MTAATLHGTCVALGGAGVLLLGGAGSGKSDLALRLIDRGFVLVADDRVVMVDGVASAPAGLAGVLEVRGLGLMRVAHDVSARVVLAVRLDGPITRLPAPARLPDLDIPVIFLDARAVSAPILVAWALDCVQGHRSQVAGAFV